MLCCRHATYTRRNNLNVETIVTVVGLLAVPALVLMNGLFVAAEFAIVTSRRTRIHKLAQHGNWRALLVERALTTQNDYIAATQLGITMASLALGWIGEPVLADLFRPMFAFLPAGPESVAAHSAAFVTAFGLITTFHIIVGELAPKSIALWHPERTAMLVIPPTHFFLIVFRPFIRLLNGLANLTLGIFGLRSPVGHHVVTSEDFGMLASESVDAGVIGEEEARIVQRTFRFAGRQAHDVMVPRPSVHAVQASWALPEIAQAFQETGFTRLPVYETNLDEISGVIVSKDVLSALIEGRSDVDASVLTRPINMVPETKDLAELLDQMRLERTHMAVVVDEYGVTAGIVTMEDLIEEIVGEITSEHRKEEEMLEWIDESSVVVDAAISLDDLNQELGVELGDEDINTLGGYVFRELGRVPAVGERFERDGIEFSVVSMVRNRVGDVILKRTEPWPKSESRQQRNGEI